MSDGMVALRRDLSERAKLDDLSKGTTGPVVTVTDGPIELWGAKGEDAKAYGEFVDQYKSYFPPAIPRRDHRRLRGQTFRRFGVTPAGNRHR